MDIGGIKTKLQQMLDAAEQLYAKMNEVVEQLTELKERLEATDERLISVERRVAEQRAIVEALARQEGVDVEAVLSEADLPPEASGTGDGADHSVDGEAAGGSGRGAEPTESGGPPGGS